MWTGSGGTNIPYAYAVGLLLVISLNNTDGSSNNVLHIFIQAISSFYVSEDILTKVRKNGEFND